MRRLVLAAALASAAACSSADQAPIVTPVAIADGRYVVVGSQGFPPADQPLLQQVGLTVDMAAGTALLWTSAPGPIWLTVASRPQDGWKADCFTMAGHALDEVADLSPAPLPIESLAFSAPVLYPKCAADRLILADGTDAEQAGGALLVLDPQ